MDSSPTGLYAPAVADELQNSSSRLLLALVNCTPSTYGYNINTGAPFKAIML
ncbi:MAG: hypothetical protein WCL29_01260 [Pseudomonadota bacterium]